MLLCELVSFTRIVFLNVLLSLLLVSCGGGGGGSSTQAPTGPSLEVAYTEKTLLFNWSEHTGETH